MLHHPILGSYEPDPVGVLLGTGYERFQISDTFGGLAKWTDDRLDILAVHSQIPNSGQFRALIAKAKQHWKTICIWEVWNPAIEQALGRYGFTPETQIEPWGEVSNGMRWDRPDETTKPV